MWASQIFANNVFFADMSRGAKLAGQTNLGLGIRFYQLRQAARFAGSSARATPSMDHPHFTPFGYTRILLASPVFSRSMAVEKSFMEMRSVITGRRSSFPALSKAVI